MLAPLSAPLHVHELVLIVLRGAIGLTAFCVMISIALLPLVAPTPTVLIMQ